MWIIAQDIQKRALVTALEAHYVPTILTRFVRHGDNVKIVAMRIAVIPPTDKNVGGPSVVGKSLNVVYALMKFEGMQIRQHGRSACR